MDLPQGENLLQHLLMALKLSDRMVRRRPCHLGLCWMWSFFPPASRQQIFIPFHQCPYISPWNLTLWHWVKFNVREFWAYLNKACWTESFMVYFLGTIPNLSVTFLVTLVLSEEASDNVFVHFHVSSSASENGYFWEIVLEFRVFLGFSRLS